jgi:hypothetical protein
LSREEAARAITRLLLSPRREVIIGRSGEIDGNLYEPDERSGTLTGGRREAADRRT